MNIKPKNIVCTLESPTDYGYQRVRFPDGVVILVSEPFFVRFFESSPELCGQQGILDAKTVDFGKPSLKEQLETKDQILKICLDKIVELTIKLNAK